MDGDPIVWVRWLTAIPIAPGHAMRVRGLSAELGGNPVLRDMDLTVAPGELVAVVGPNGSGKPTLLRCLADPLPATGGTVEVSGAPPNETRPSDEPRRTPRTAR